MNSELKRSKQDIRSFLNTIPTQRLVEMLAWAQDGKMKYSDCCACLLGCAGAHTLHAYGQSCGPYELHYTGALTLPGAYAAEMHQPVTMQQVEAVLV